jgi:predicted permease
MGIFLDTLFNDTKHAIRHFRRSPGFAVAAILTLTLGIGANTAMFSVLNRLTFQRLALSDPDGLYSLSSYDDRGRKRYIPMPTVIDLNQDSPFIEACGYNGGGSFPVEANGIAAQAITAFVTGRCFSVFGVQPVLGRAIVDADAPIMSAAEKIVVISDRLWLRLFNRDPAVIGKRIRIEAAAATVIGVMPPGFRAIHADVGADIFAPPDSIYPATAGRRPVAQEVLGRLKPGITAEQAQARFDVMWPPLANAARESMQQANEGAGIIGAVVRLDPMSRGLSPARDQYGDTMTIILALTAVLLILACVNLGGLLLTRLSARHTELGMRLALGGSRARIAQQMLLESLVLAGTGTVLAVPLAYALVAPLPALLDPGFVGWELSFAPDWRVVGLTALVGFTVGLLLTALPLLFAMRRRATATFTWDRTTTLAANRWSRALLVAQIALSVTLVVGAGLLARSLHEIGRTNPGVKTAGIMSANVMLLPGGLRGLNADAHYPALADRLRDIPGVREVSYSSVFPRRISNLVADIGFAGEEFTGVRASSDSVSLNFFEMMDIRLIEGRYFTASDTRAAPRVVVVSDNLARALSPNAGIVGRRLRYQTNRASQDLLVVGVVANATQGDLRNPAPLVMYSPAAQSPGFNTPHVQLMIDGHPPTIAAAIRQAIQEQGREFVYDIAMLDDLLAAGPRRERLSALLAGVIGVLALILAVIGIHGVLGYSVTRRTREIGIRVAVGAHPGVVARAVIREAATLTSIGLIVGVPAAFVSARALRSLLFGITETDVMTFAGVSAFILVVGLAAGALPARRAARVDPVIALRTE